MPLPLNGDRVSARRGKGRGGLGIMALAEDMHNAERAVKMETGIIECILGESSLTDRYTARERTGRRGRMAPR